MHTLVMTFLYGGLVLGVLALLNWAMEHGPEANERICKHGLPWPQCTACHCIG